MGREIVTQTIKMFDSVDKWNSYLELIKLKDEIRNDWFFKAKTEISRHFLEKDVVEGWSFYAWNAWDFRWYLTEHGKESFCVWMFSNRLCFWASGNVIDSVKLTELLGTEKFSIIMSLLRPDEIFNNEFKISEFGNFGFDSVSDFNLDPDRLAWFAGNCTESYVNQIVEKLNHIRKNETVTNLFRELNSLSKK